VDPIPVSWAHPDPAVRGPVICTVRHSAQRNAIGAHQGSYCIYTGLAVAAGKLDPDYVPNLKLTSPVFQIGPHASWADPRKMAAMDPFGHMTTQVYSEWIEKGWDIRPTIAVTKAHIDLPECREAITAGRLIPDGKILMASGQSVVAKAAIEPVWYLPEIARRFETTESNLRQSVFRMTNGMYPELITRPDIKVFLPPIGGVTIYIWGDPDTIPDEDIELTCRVHDECNGSDVSGAVSLVVVVVVAVAVVGRSLQTILRPVYYPHVFIWKLAVGTASLLIYALFFSLLLSLHTGLWK
jgi:hypothetical protein